jgi:hypothetical protein
MKAWQPFKLVIKVDPPTMDFMEELFNIDMLLLSIIGKNP